MTMPLGLCQFILIYYELAERRVDAKNVAKDAKQLNLVSLIHILLHQHSQSQANTALPSSADPDYLDFTEMHPLTTYKSAVATFYAPSDLSGTGGMRKEQIRAVSCWRGGPLRFDTVLLKPNRGSEFTTNDEPTVNSFSVARVWHFFSFEYNQASYECALVHDYQVVNPSPDEITGMAIVKRATSGSLPRARVVLLDDILRAIHLIPVFSQLGTKPIPKNCKYELMLDNRQLFKQFYVNKFIDHHAFEILS